MIGGPGKEHSTNKLPPSERIQERSKGERTCQFICPTNLPESSSLESILAEQCTVPPGRTLSQWLAREKLETTPITIKAETVSQIAEQFSWVPLPYCSPPRCPFPIKSLALSARVSSDNSFLSVRQEPTFGALYGGLPLPTTEPLLVCILKCCDPSWSVFIKNGYPFFEMIAKII